MISICEKVRLQQLRKEKYSILSSILNIFQNIFLTEPHTYFVQYTESLVVFLYLTLNIEFFLKKCVKKGGAQFLYCLECKADIAILLTIS